MLRSVPFVKTDSEIHGQSRSKDPCKHLKMEDFATIVKGFWSLIIVAKFIILVVCGGLGYVLNGQYLKLFRFHKVF